MEKSQHTRAYARLTAALRAPRARAGLTQQEVAAALGAYASYVSKVEAGERRVDVVELVTLCGVYRIELAELLREAKLIR
jgi:transcriptional regulator with XRE-family HTH domain